MMSVLKPSIVLASCLLAYQNTSKDFKVSNLFSGSKKETPKQTKTFIWGNGFYHARPDAAMQFKNFEPKQIKTFTGEKNINFKELNFGEFHEGGIDTKGNFYIWRKHKLDASFARHDADEVRNDVLELDNSGNVKQVAFSKGWAWGLRNNGEVYQWQIKSAEQDEYDEDNVKVEVNKTPRKIDVLKDIVQISTGEDHFAALDKDGSIWIMGDDTYGQCGLGANKRMGAPPFFHQRVRLPTRIPNLSNIKKVACGANHTLALTNEGVVYGWGSNSNLQLSHEQEFSVVDNPLIAVFAPLRMEKNLGSVSVTDLAAGEAHTIFVSRNKFTGETEVYGCGKNLVGQLGIGTLSHINDVVKIESLSNYKVTTSEGEKDITIQQVSCGDNHCMALLSVGAVLEWGGNEYGQLGNRKRTFTEHPIIVSDFTDETVLSIAARYHNSSVITEYDAELERLKEEKRKNKKGKKH